MPTVPYLLYLSVKARSPFFYGACNPIIHHNGGGNRASKAFMLRNFDKKHLPQTILVNPKIERSRLQAQLNEAGLTFPLIAKPDSGDRGSGVVKVKNIDRLIEVLRDNFYDVLVQEVVDSPHEFGVLYWRMPGETKGRVTSVSEKVLLHVVGNGRDNLLQLASTRKKNQRFLKKVREINKDRLDYVPAEGEVVILDYVAQKARGAIFRDSTHLITPEVEARFNEICRNVEGYYYGRFDLKAESVDSLRTGEGLKILELNGTASIPLHIWDHRISLFGAYKIMLKHWNIVYRIAVANHRRGVPYLTPSETVSYLRKRFFGEKEESTVVSPRA